MEEQDQPQGLSPSPAPPFGRRCSPPAPHTEPDTPKQHWKQEPSISLEKIKNQPRGHHILPQSWGQLCCRPGSGSRGPLVAAAECPWCVPAVPGCHRGQARLRGSPSAPRRCWLGSSTSWGPGPGCGAGHGSGTPGTPLPAGPPVLWVGSSSVPHRPQKVTPVGICPERESCIPTWGWVQGGGPTHGDRALHTHLGLGTGMGPTHTHHWGCGQGATHPPRNWDRDGVLDTPGVPPPR